MSYQQSQSDKIANMTRREFMRDTTLAAAGLAVGMGAGAGQTARADETSCKTGNVGGLIKTTRSYNPNMEYRRLGKTSLWISAISLGGHWKKLPFSFGTEEFKKNRRDVVSACIDHGINYIDACTGGEILAYADALRGVKNVARAVTEHRKFDIAEAQRFERAVSEMWANLPQNYQWLKREWEYV